MPPLSVEALVSLLISLRPILLWGLQALPELSEFLIMGLERTRFFFNCLSTNHSTLIKRNDSQKNKRAKGQKGNQSSQIVKVMIQ